MLSYRRAPCSGSRTKGGQDSRISSEADLEWGEQRFVGDDAHDSEVLATDFSAASRRFERSRYGAGEEPRSRGENKFVFRSNGDGSPTSEVALTAESDDEAIATLQQVNSYEGSSGESGNKCPTAHELMLVIDGQVCTPVADSTNKPHHKVTS